jgi:hypothetical protein
MAFGAYNVLTKNSVFMKTQIFPQLRPVSVLASALTLATALTVTAQTVLTPQVVTIVATDPTATEIPLVPPRMGMPQRFDDAIFVVSRTGSTDFPLDVFYTVGGTAANGGDYEKLTGKVTIPLGAQSATIEVMPIDDLLVEGTETVVVTLSPIACITIYPPPRECYQVGSPNRAMADILDNDKGTNSSPVVTITAPDPIASEGTNCYQIMIYPPPTNNPCVSNTATFVVRRTGPTNNSLTVHYCIGGTASNGVDYVALPGVVTIPAGRRAAEFKVVPLDDNLREKVETVVLKLCVPPTALAVVPPYLIGCPARAAAIIVDNDHPRPGTGRLPDRCFHVMKSGANGTWWRIECSTDMTQWTPICTVPVMDGAIDFVDPDADELPARFYRAVPESSPPPE